MREEAELKAEVQAPGAGMEADLGVEVRGRQAPLGPGTQREGSVPGGIMS